MYHHERQSERGARPVHSGVNLITKYGCQIQAKPFHPVRLPTIRVYAKVRESGGHGERIYIIQRSTLSKLLYVIRFSSPGIKLLVIPLCATADPPGDVPFQ